VEADPVSPFLIQRAERLARLFPHPSIDRPLVKGFAADIEIIRAIAQRVLDDSFGLGNITPNGAVMERPKISNLLRMFRQAVFNEVDLRGLDKISSPILRCQTESHKERPFSTEKMHSDVWRGDPRSTLVILLPLWGCEFSTVKFREPKFDSFQPLVDYRLGNTEGTDYEIPFHEGMIYYCDAFCLHQTVRIKDGARVSVDIRGLYEQCYPEDASPWNPVSIFHPVKQELAA
jgi:hypothetical protein